MEEAFRTPRKVGQMFRPDATEAFARLTASAPGSCIACDTPDVLEIGGRVDEGTHVSADGPQENAERMGRRDNDNSLLQKLVDEFMRLPSVSIRLRGRIRLVDPLRMSDLLQERATVRVPRILCVRVCVCVCVCVCTFCVRTVHCTHTRARTRLQ